MCDFISWIEREGHIYLFTNKELNTKEGRKIQKGLKDNDVRGHGVIREYWGLKDGVNKECEDFSTPDNFPKEIVKAVKLGQYSEIGFNLDLLNSAGKAEYEKIRQPAFWDIFQHKKYRNKKWL